MTLLTAILIAASWTTATSSSLVTKTISFAQYHSNFERSYEPGSDEYIARQLLFDERAKDIVRQNSLPGALWRATLNQFTDRTEQELTVYRGRRGSPGAQQPKQLGLLGLKPTVAESADWGHLKSMVPEDQRGCGSCWAFATVAMLRAHTEIHTNRTSDYSPQQLVDCVENPLDCGGTGGCQGATVELAMKYIVAVGGLDQFSFRSESPYTATDGTCPFSKRVSSAVSLSAEGAERSPQIDATGGDADHVGEGKMGLLSWSTLPSNRALPLMQALMEGPVAISVAAGKWFSYDSGVFNSCTTSDQASLVIDHAVVAAGYGRMDVIQHGKLKPTNYWRILNSWGPLWGDDGHINILRHDTATEDDNFCGDDLKPEDGIACKDPETKKYPTKARVCGMCGLLFDSVAPKYGKLVAAVQSHSSLRGKNT